MSELLIGRQPIFDRKLDVVAYELLYRSVGSANKAVMVDGYQATREVILNSFSEVGLETLVGKDKKAYINATRQFIIKKDYAILPKGRVVIEVLEDIVINQEMIDALRELKREKYEMALDDVINLQPVAKIIDLANIIKVDLMGFDLKGQTEDDRLDELEIKLRNIIFGLQGRPVYLLAEKVETQAEYDLCFRLGFHYFQGYFLCKPIIVKGRRLDASRTVVLRSISEMQDSNYSAQKLEGIISQDVALVNKLLKVINSGYYAMENPVKSVHQAITMIGTKQLLAWMTLLMISTVDNKPHELTSIALQRARMCEGFARAKSKAHTETYFLVGLLSVMDALMDTPMDQLVVNMPLSPEVLDALIGQKGEYGYILNTVMAYEQGDWDTVLKLNLSSETIRNVYLDAIQSVMKTMKELYTTAK
jgi:EAL and modified HD-GYP domain-containing signal transduction protein